MVLGDLPGVSDGLVEAGLEELSASGADGVCPDLVIATPDHVERALAFGASSILFEGSALEVSAALSTAGARGLETSCLLPLPGIDYQHLVMDLRHRSAAGYALARWAPTGGRRSTWLKLIAVRRLVHAGMLPPMRARLGTAVAPEGVASAAAAPDGARVGRSGTARPVAQAAGRPCRCGQPGPRGP